MSEGAGPPSPAGAPDESLDDAMAAFSDDDESVVGRKRRREKKEKKSKKEKKEKKRKRARREESDRSLELADLSSGDYESSEMSDEGRAQVEEVEEDDDGVVLPEQRRGPQMHYLARYQDQMQEDKLRVADDDSDEGIALNELGQGVDDEDDDSDDGAVEPDEDEQAMLGKYPTIADPKLFMIRVKGGFARTICVQIMYKCLTRAAQGHDMMIKSAFCRDHLSEYIYVEAHRQVHVMNAISGLQGVWRSRVTLIPVQEMPSTLGKMREASNVRPGSWGRFRYGLHKGDLCRIKEVDNAKECYVVEVIPRVDFDKLFDPNQNTGNEAGFRVNKLRTRVRPRQKFFTDEEFRKTRYSQHYATMTEFEQAQDDVDPEAREDCIRCLGKKFSFSGHEIKTVRQQAVGTEKRFVRLTTDEHIAFERGQIPSSKREIKRLQEIREVDLAVSDRVRVTQGELKNTRGTVKEIIYDAGGTKYMIQPDADSGLNTVIPLTRGELAKEVPLGANVKIIAGGHEGETGTVVSLGKADKTNVVSVFVEERKEELQVFMSDVVVTKEVSSAAPSYGNFELFELVKLPGAQAGMIIKIENNMFRVLDSLGKVIPCKAAQLSDVLASTKDSLVRKGRRHSGLDRYGNEVQQDDIVRVVSDKSLWEGKTATVRHVYRDSLWLEAEGVYDNMGFFVMNTKEVWLVGGDRKRQDLSIDAYVKPTSSREGPETAVLEMGEKDAKKQKKKSRDMLTLVGKRVRVTKGYHKGYLGRVTAVHGDQVRVELHTGELGLTVPIEHVVEIGVFDSLATAEQVRQRKYTHRNAADGPGKIEGAEGARDVVLDDQSEAETVAASEWMSNLSGFSKSRAGSFSGSRSGSRALGSLAGSRAGSLGGASLGSQARRGPSRSRLQSGSRPRGDVPEKVHPGLPWWAVQGAVATHRNERGDEQPVVVVSSDDGQKVLVRTRGSRAGAHDGLAFAVPIGQLQWREPQTSNCWLVAIPRAEEGATFSDEPIMGKYVMRTQINGPDEVPSIVVSSGGQATPCPVSCTVEVENL